ncbi:MAG TPA: FAD-dependent oxidoreductase, partial [Pseudonocardiaceae bacterium]
MTAMRVAVVGAGITGLTAAYRLRRELGPDVTITVLELTDRLGGKLRTVELAGRPYDIGAEAFLVRRPEMAALAGELGMAGELANPTSAAAGIRAAGETRPIPVGTVLGVPVSPGAVAGVLSEDGVR